EGLPANFIIANAFEEGKPDYDLVFNAGVLEHYSENEQVELLHGMASRSRRLLLTLVPNRSCYWYWLWRMQRSREGNWPYGDEKPSTQLESLFEKAGIPFIGQSFFGATWTEDFIENITGINETLRSM